MRTDSAEVNNGFGFRVLLSAVFVLISINLGFLPPATPAARRPFGGTLMVHMQSEVRTTDPAKIGTALELQVADQIHDTLFRLASDGSIRPALAHEMPQLQDEGKVLLIRLRPRATFHDGTRITSDEVIASWQRLVRSETNSPHWWLLSPVQGAISFRLGRSTKISGLESINRLTLRIRLRGSYPSFLECLAALPTAPLPTRRLKGPRVNHNHPPGSGPFAWQFSSTGSGAIALSAFLGHVRGRPYVDRLVFKPFSSDREAHIALQLGSIHLAWTCPSQRAGEQTYRVQTGPTISMVFLAVNPKLAQGLPGGLQQAMKQVLDRRALVDYLVGDGGRAVNELVAFEQTEQASQLDQTDKRDALAYFKRLVQMEHREPLYWTILVQKHQALERQIAERIQLQLMDLGIDVSIMYLERGPFEQRMLDKEYDLAVVQPLSLVHAPELKLLGLVATARLEEGVEHFLKWHANISGKKNTDALLKQRIRYEGERLSWIPLFQYARNICVHESVRECVVEENGLINMANLWLPN